MPSDGIQSPMLDQHRQHFTTKTRSRSAAFHNQNTIKIGSISQPKHDQDRQHFTTKTLTEHCRTQDVLKEAQNEHKVLKIFAEGADAPCKQKSLCMHK
jgi:hypothetical protein